jgi:MtrB/PioB family decaheme-associated outer membrane protein
MNNHKYFSAPLGAALLAVTVPVAAEEDEVTKLITPESTVTAGVGYVSKDNQRFGQFTGLDEQGAYGLLNLDLVRRDEETGTWLMLRGRNLGLDHRDVRLDHERQGNWGYFLEFSQTPRTSPFTVNTGLEGIGTDQLNRITIAPGAGSDVRLKTERDAVSVGLSKVLATRFDAQLRFRHEKKEGARPFGRGTGIFLAEPIDYVTQQYEATLGYAGDRLQLLGGYYGTRFKNEHAVLNDILHGDATTLNQVSLPPDNHSHQAHLGGGYSFTPTTRGTFKVAYTRATQDDGFFTARETLDGHTRTSLDGRVDTTLAQLGFSTRPLPRLSVLANVRYEDRDDKTPTFQFLAPSATRDGFNVPHSRTTTTGNVEASYRLPGAIRLIGGAEHDRRKRSAPPVQSVSYRERTDETSYRVGLSRAMGETLNGSVFYVRSERDGSDYLPTAIPTDPIGGVVGPIHWADRDRDKWRVVLDWLPVEAFSVQAIVEDSRDRYTGREFGPRKGEARFASLDATYALSEDWQVSAWVSRDETRLDQAVQKVTEPIFDWAARLRHRGDAVGVGLRGRPLSRLALGADLQYAHDRSEHAMEALTPGELDALPDITYRLSSLTLFMDYTLRANSGVRLNYIYERTRTDDWTWNGSETMPQWVYTDGTTVVQNPDEKVHFIGVSYYMRWW